MAWLARLVCAFVVLTSASTAWCDCPAPVDQKARDTPAPGVLLERLGGAGDNEIAVDQPRVVIPWLLRACAVDKASVKLPDVELRGPNGEVHRLEFADAGGKALRDKPVALMRGDPMLLLLRSTDGALLAPGSHVGVVRVHDASASAPQALAAVPIRLKHTRSTVPAMIASAPVTSHDVDIFHGSRMLELRQLVRVHDSGSARPTLRAESLTRRRSDSAQTAEPLEPPAAPASAASAADGSTTYTLAFDQIDAPGRYDAVLRLAQDGYTDQTSKLTFYLRDPAWLAFLFILLGVIASYGMGLYGAVWRPRLVSRQRIGTVIDQLRSAEAAAEGDAESLALVRQVTARLEAAWNDARSRRTPIDEATVSTYAEIAQALQTWPAVVARLKAIQPASVGLALLDELRDAGKAFSAAKLDVEAVKKASATLAGMPDAARKKGAEALAKAIAELEKLLHNATAPGLAAARTQVTRAEGLLSESRFDDALAAYDTAVAQYADHYGAVLEALADKSKTAPIGVRRDDWDTICDDTRRVLAESAAAWGGEARLRALQMAAKVYLSSCAASLRRHTQGLPQATRDAVEARLVEMDAALEAGAIATATEKFDAAVAVVTAGAATGSVMGGAPVPGTTFDAVAVFDLPSAWPSVARPGAAADAQESIWRFDLLLSLIVIVVAGIAGVEAVWSKDPAWGGAASYLGAFLFGLAVDQFTKTGVAALRAMKP